MNKSNGASPPVEPNEEEANQVEDDNISKKVKELELSLPRKKWGSNRYNYLYQNFWVPARYLRGVISFQEQFQAQDSDIFLISKPKCGTTWLQALAFAIQNCGVYLIHGSKPHPLLSHHPEQLVPKLEAVMSKNDTLHLRSRLFATHLPYNALPDCIKTSACRIIYIARNILDTVISFCYFSHQINVAENDEGDPMRLEDYVDSFCRGDESYGPHWDNVLGYWQESLKRPDKVLFIKYEDIKGDEVSEITRLAEFMGCPFTSVEKLSGVVDEIVRLCSFQSLKKMEVNKSGIATSVSGLQNSAFFRKGEVGDWMNHMSPSMVENLEKLMEDKFLGSGLTFKTVTATSTTSPLS